MTRVAKIDYYEVLGLPRTADEEEVRRAFRSLARKLHPDVSDEPRAEERFRDVTAAYSVLSRPGARFLYDRFGYRGRGNGGFGETEWRSARVLAEIELDAFEADRGAKREVRFAVDDPCETCGGGGAAPGTKVRVCEICGGNGRLRVSSGLNVGRWLQITRCHDCSGLGRVYEKACPECRGLGSVTKRRVVKVRIPPGVVDGTRLRVMGEPAEDHLLVRVLPGPVDSLLVRWAATVLLACAVALLVYLIWWA